MLPKYEQGQNRGQKNREFIRQKLNHSSLAIKTDLTAQKHSFMLPSESMKVSPIVSEHAERQKRIRYGQQERRRKLYAPNKSSDVLATVKFKNPVLGQKLALINTKGNKGKQRTNVNSLEFEHNPRNLIPPAEVSAHTSMFQQWLKESQTQEQTWQLLKPRTYQVSNMKFVPNLSKKPAIF